MAKGGDITYPGWSLLYQIAEAIGVNISALVKYFGQRGMLSVDVTGGNRRLIAAPRFAGMEDWIR